MKRLRRFICSDFKKGYCTTPCFLKIAYYKTEDEPTIPTHCPYNSGMGVTWKLFKKESK
jgi:hypothetical protein